LSQSESSSELLARAYVGEGYSKDALNTIEELVEHIGVLASAFDQLETRVFAQ